MARRDDAEERHVVEVLVDEGLAHVRELAVLRRDGAQAFDQARRRAVVELNSVAEFDALSLVDESADVAEAVCTRQELEFLANALRELPDGCRSALTLCKMYGYTPKEIADQLGISEHTVRAQVAKGIRRCAEYFRRRDITRQRQ